MIPRSFAAAVSSSKRLSDRDNCENSVANYNNKSESFNAVVNTNNNSSSNGPGPKNSFENLSGIKSYSDHQNLNLLSKLNNSYLQVFCNNNNFVLCENPSQTVIKKATGLAGFTEKYDVASSLQNIANTEYNFGKAICVPRLPESRNERRCVRVEKCYDIDASINGFYQWKGLEKHPNVLEILDCYCDNSRYIASVIPACLGTDLCDLVASASKKADVKSNFSTSSSTFEAQVCPSGIPMPKLMRLFEQMCFATQHLHNSNILHRDIKLDNFSFETASQQTLLLSPPEYLECCLNVPKSSRSQNVSQLVGTLYYLAPETLSKKIYSDKSDVYALGVCLHVLLTGQFPYEIKSVDDTPKSNFSLLMKHHKPQIVSLCKGMLDENPKTRWSLTKVIEKLEEFQACQAIVGISRRPSMIGEDIERRVNKLLSEEIKLLSISLKSQGLVGATNNSMDFIRSNSIRGSWKRADQIQTTDEGLLLTKLGVGIPLFQEGEPANTNGQIDNSTGEKLERNIYILQKGCVNVYSNGVLVDTFCNQGTIIGEEAFSNAITSANGPNCFTTTVKGAASTDESSDGTTTTGSSDSAAELLVIGESDFEKILFNNPSLKSAIDELIVTRGAKADQRVKEQSILYGIGSQYEAKNDGGDSDYDSSVAAGVLRQSSLKK